jgi:hypothetical protein
VTAGAIAVVCLAAGCSTSNRPSRPRPPAIRVFRGVGVLSSSATGAGSHGMSSIVDDFLPGATATLQSSPSRGNKSAARLIIQLSPESTKDKTKLQQDFMYEEIGWRAEIAYDIINSGDADISSYRVTTSDGRVPPAALNDFHGGTTTIPGLKPMAHPGLDTVPASLALQQLKSSIEILTDALPAGSVTSASVVLLPTDRRNQYALEADITINQASSLDGHYGDALEGLQTGLTGDPASTIVEGIAIVVTAADGSPVLGGWQSTRDQSGTLQFGDPSKANTELLRVTRPFPDVTNGPGTKIGALGLMGGRCQPASLVDKPRRSS